MAPTAEQEQEGSEGTGAPSPDAHDATAHELVELPLAQATILAAIRPLAAESVPIERMLGRVLAEDLNAQAPVPSFDSSAMDGFAVRAEDLAHASREAPIRLAVIDESRAGSPATRPVGRGEAIAISTGAMMPDGADAVVRVEHARCSEEPRRAPGHAAAPADHDVSGPRHGTVAIWAAVDPGLEVRRAGEDIRAGDAVLARGTALGPAALGVLASLGRTQALCARRPRLGLLLTGDELIAAEEPARPGAVRDSNSHTIAALARCFGAEIARIVKAPDGAEATKASLALAPHGLDALVICGGMSVGEHDHVRPSLDALGAQRAFWGLALRPGKPTWFGTLSGVPVFGLPGNPVSAMVTFVLLVAPALRALQGATSQPARVTARIDSNYEKSAGRAHALRCRLRAEPDGWHATLTGPQGSHILTSLLDADALAIVPSETTFVAAGTRLDVVPLPSPAGAFA